VELDGHPVGTGAIGEVTSRLAAAYEELVSAELEVE